MNASGKTTSSAPSDRASAVRVATRSSVPSRSRIAGSACTDATVTALRTAASLYQRPARDLLERVRARQIQVDRRHGDPTLGDCAEVRVRLVVVGRVVAVDPVGAAAGVVLPEVEP